jgi:hypothetical protein
MHIPVHTHLCTLLALHHAVLTHMQDFLLVSQQMFVRVPTPSLSPLLCSRCHWRMLPPPYHASLIDALQQAAGGMSRRARTRPGPGPGPWVALKRILPGPPPLQPVALALVAGGAGGGAAQQGPFIFNPYAAKRSAAAAAGAVQAVEWVSGGACRGTTAFRLRGAAGA